MLQIDDAFLVLDLDEGSTPTQNIPFIFISILGSQYSRSRIYSGDSSRIEHPITGQSEHTIPGYTEHLIPECKYHNINE